MARVYISLGSNIEAPANICSCIRTLRQDFPDAVFSTIYQTPAVGFAGDPFLNLVAGFDTTLPYQAIKDYLRDLEDTHGRKRGTAKFSARTLDADLLLYDGLNLQPTENLPHKDILHYPFVLYPLAEIAGTARHPENGRTIAELAQAIRLPRDGMQPVELDCLNR